MGRSERGPAKEERTEMDVHHRRPRSIGGDNSPQNLVVVKKRLHRMWHGLFDNFDVWTIARLINHTWIDWRYAMVPVRRKYLERAMHIAKKLDDRERAREKRSKKKFSGPQD